MNCSHDALRLLQVVGLGVGFSYLFTFPRCREARFRGRKANEPWRGASNFLWDIMIELVLERGYVNSSNINARTEKSNIVVRDCRPLRVRGDPRRSALAVPNAASSIFCQETRPAE